MTAITFGNAIIAGSIFALTDWLALSGTGHLAIISVLFDLQLQQQHLLLKALIELAVVLAAIIAYRKDVADRRRKKSREEERQISGSQDVVYALHVNTSAAVYAPFSEQFFLSLE